MKNKDLIIKLMEKQKEPDSRVREIKEVIERDTRLSYDQVKTLLDCEIFPILISVGPNQDYYLYDGGDVGLFGIYGHERSQFIDKLDSYYSSERKKLFEQAVEEYYAKEIKEYTDDVKIEWEKKELDNIKHWRDLVSKGHRLPYIPRDYYKAVQDVMGLLAFQVTKGTNYYYTHLEDIVDRVVDRLNALDGRELNKTKIVGLVNAQFQAIDLLCTIEDLFDTYSSDAHSQLLDLIKVNEDDEYFYNLARY